ncbi:hypothetical protein [Clostridium sp. YIM B02551]|uniref:hypothetical protein n=1 Tax=Clostridium sp. YIM B02551 TaxID=2910679 RepID=UPI001EEACEC2|nr:hypothetical protein [Clostridium sp. YIM B02551]
MSLKQEIFRALLLTFGTAQIILNSGYLIKKNGIELSRRQHGEIPNNTSNDKMRVKVICMLLVGIMFFIVSLGSYILHSFLYTPIFIALIVFVIYGVLEALYYKYWKTTGFAIVTIVLLFLYLI